MLKWFEMYKISMNLKERYTLEEKEKEGQQINHKQLLMEQCEVSFSAASGWANM